MEVDCLGVMIIGMRRNSFNGLWGKQSMHNDRPVFSRKYPTCDSYLYWEESIGCWVIKNEITSDGREISRIENGSCSTQYPWTSGNVDVKKMTCELGHNKNALKVVIQNPPNAYLKALGGVYHCLPPSEYVNGREHFSKKMHN